MPFSVKTQVKVSTTGKLRKRLNVTMKHATHAATKTMPTSNANSSQTRQRFSRSMSNNVQRVPALVFTAKGSPSSHSLTPVSYTHLRAHETRHDLVCRLLLEKKKKT